MASELIDVIEHPFARLRVEVTGHGVLLSIAGTDNALSILLETPEARDRFARAWMEACRRADGEAPAAGAREHG